MVEYLEKRRKEEIGDYVFPGRDGENAFGSFPNHWRKTFAGSSLADVTPHILRHSFASVANDLGFTEVTIAALVGHAKASVTSNYIHTLDTALVIAPIQSPATFRGCSKELSSSKPPMRLIVAPGRPYWPGFSRGRLAMRTRDRTKACISPHKSTNLPSR